MVCGAEYHTTQTCGEALESPHCIYNAPVINIIILVMWDTYDVWS